MLMLENLHFYGAPKVILNLIVTKYRASQTFFTPPGAGSGSPFNLKVETHGQSGKEPGWL